MFNHLQLILRRAVTVAFAVLLLFGVPGAQAQRDESSSQAHSRSSSSSSSSSKSSTVRSRSSSNSQGTRSAVPRASPPPTRATPSTPDQIHRGRDTPDADGASGSGHQDADRDLRGRGRTSGIGGSPRGGSGHDYPYYYGGGYGGGYGYGHYSGYYGYPYGYGPYLSFRLHHYPYPYYYPFGWGSYGAPRGYGYRDAYRSGALDLDLRPDKAEVYVDGRYVGLVDQFDGFPDYLWLEEGDYDIAVYTDGFETFSRQVRVRAGNILRIKERLVRGEAIRPEAVSPLLAKPLPEQELASILLTVSPLDAAIYLDGRLVGRADEVSRLDELVAGDHLLQVVRPGHEPRELAFSIDAGEEVELDIDLALLAGS